jgi:hypothetical protein
VAKCLVLEVPFIKKVAPLAFANNSGFLIVPSPITVGRAGLISLPRHDPLIANASLSISSPVNPLGRPLADQRLSWYALSRESVLISCRTRMPCAALRALITAGCDAPRVHHGKRA